MNIKDQLKSTRPDGILVLNKEFYEIRAQVIDGKAYLVRYEWDGENGGFYVSNCSCPLKAD